MKNVKCFFIATTLALFTVSCGSDGNSPAGIEKAMYTQLQKGNYEKAVEILFDNLDNGKEDVNTDEKAEAIKAFAGKAKKSDEAKGGIKSFEIIEEKISEDGNSATVETKITYGNGTEDTNTSKYVKKDGKWKVSLGK
jgi:hypothetical protein